MRVLLNTFAGVLLLGFTLGSSAQADEIMPQGHWDRCIAPLWVDDPELVSEMRRKTPPLVTEDNYYLDFSRAGEDCGLWIWKVMGQSLANRKGSNKLFWQLLLQKFFYHFKRGEIPDMDDLEALRQEACPSALDRRMQWPHGVTIVVARDEEGNVTDKIVGALGDPRCALLDEVDKGE